MLNDGGREEARNICCMFKTNELTRFHKIYTYFVHHKEMEETKDGLAYKYHDLTERVDDVPDSEIGVLS
eukprot:1091550-Ditylum_brightwellii.AAC.1